MLIELAGLTVDVATDNKYVRALCAPYRAPQGAVVDFSVAVDGDELSREGVRDPDAPASIVESAAIYRKLCHAALGYDRLLIHGSALTLDGVGYLFTAPSGTGKSTHAALWRAVFGDRVAMVNDDKPLLYITPDGVSVCGTPWAGKHNLSTPGMFPLRAICFLERGAENSIRRATYGEIYARLLGQTYRPRDAALMGKTLELLDTAQKTLTFYILTCNKEPDAALVACRGMGGSV